MLHIEVAAAAASGGGGGTATPRVAAAPTAAAAPFAVEAAKLVRLPASATSQSSGDGGGAASWDGAERVLAARLRLVRQQRRDAYAAHRLVIREAVPDHGLSGWGWEGGGDVNDAIASARWRRLAAVEAAAVRASATRLPATTDPVPETLRLVQAARPAQAWAIAFEPPPPPLQSQPLSPLAATAASPSVRLAPLVERAVNTAGFTPTALLKAAMTRELSRARMCGFVDVLVVPPSAGPVATSAAAGDGDASAGGSAPSTALPSAAQALGSSPPYFVEGHETIVHTRVPAPGTHLSSDAAPSLLRASDGSLLIDDREVLSRHTVTYEGGGVWEQRWLVLTPDDTLLTFTLCDSRGVKSTRRETATALRPCDVIALGPAGACEGGYMPDADDIDSEAEGGDADRGPDTSGSHPPDLHPAAVAQLAIVGLREWQLTTGNAMFTFRCSGASETLAWVSAITQRHRLMSDAMFLTVPEAAMATDAYLRSAVAGTLAAELRTTGDLLHVSIIRDKLQVFARALQLEPLILAWTHIRAYELGHPLTPLVAPWLLAMPARPPTASPPLPASAGAPVGGHAAAARASPSLSPRRANGLSPPASAAAPPPPPPPQVAGAASPRLHASLGPSALGASSLHKSDSTSSVDSLPLLAAATGASATVSRAASPEAGGAFASQHSPLAPAAPPASSSPSPSSALVSRGIGNGVGGSGGLASPPSSRWRSPSSSSTTSLGLGAARPATTIAGGISPEPGQPSGPAAYPVSPAATPAIPASPRQFIAAARERLELGVLPLLDATPQPGAGGGASTPLSGGAGVNPLRRYLADDDVRSVYYQVAAVFSRFVNAAPWAVFDSDVPPTAVEAGIVAPAPGTGGGIVQGAAAFGGIWGIGVAGGGGGALSSASSSLPLVPLPLVAPLAIALAQAQLALVPLEVPADKQAQVAMECAMRVQALAASLGAWLPAGEGGNGMRAGVAGIAPFLAATTGYAGLLAAPVVSQPSAGIGGLRTLALTRTMSLSGAAGLGAPPTSTAAAAATAAVASGPRRTWRASVDVTNGAGPSAATAAALPLAAPGTSAGSMGRLPSSGSASGGGSAVRSGADAGSSFVRQGSLGSGLGVGARLQRGSVFGGLPGASAANGAASSPAASSAAPPTPQLSAELQLRLLVCLAESVSMIAAPWAMYRLRLWLESQIEARIVVPFLQRLAIEHLPADHALRSIIIGGLPPADAVADARAPTPAAGGDAGGGAARSAQASRASTGGAATTGSTITTSAAGGTSKSGGLFASRSFNFSRRATATVAVPNPAAGAASSGSGGAIGVPRRSTLAPTTSSAPRVAGGGAAGGGTDVTAGGALHLVVARNSISAAGSGSGSGSGGDAAVAARRPSAPPLTAAVPSSLPEGDAAVALDAAAAIAAAMGSMDEGGEASAARASAALAASLPRADSGSLQTGMAALAGSYPRRSIGAAPSDVAGSGPRMPRSFSRRPTLRSIHEAQPTVPVPSLALVSSARDSASPGASVSARRGSTSLPDGNRGHSGSLAVVTLPHGGGSSGGDGDGFVGIISGGGIESVSPQSGRGSFSVAQRVRGGSLLMLGASSSPAAGGVLRRGGGDEAAARAGGARASRLGPAVSLNHYHAIRLGEFVVVQGRAGGGGPRIVPLSLPVWAMSTRLPAPTALARPFIEWLWYLYVPRPVVASQLPSGTPYTLATEAAARRGLIGESNDEAGATDAPPPYATTARMASAASMASTTSLASVPAATASGLSFAPYSGAGGSGSSIMPILSAAAASAVASGVVSAGGSLSSIASAGSAVWRRPGVALAFPTVSPKPANGAMTAASGGGGGGSRLLRRASQQDGGGLTQPAAAAPADCSSTLSAAKGPPVVSMLQVLAPVLVAEWRRKWDRARGLTRRFNAVTALAVGAGLKTWAEDDDEEDGVDEAARRETAAARHRALILTVPTSTRTRDQVFPRSQVHAHGRRSSIDVAGGSALSRSARASDSTTDGGSARRLALGAATLLPFDVNEPPTAEELHDAAASGERLEYEDDIEPCGDGHHHSDAAGYMRFARRLGGAAPAPSRGRVGDGPVYESEGEGDGASHGSDSDSTSSTPRVTSARAVDDADGPARSTSPPLVKASPPAARRAGPRLPSLPSPFTYTGGVDVHHDVLVPLLHKYRVPVKDVAPFIELRFQAVNGDAAGIVLPPTPDGYDPSASATGAASSSGGSGAATAAGTVTSRAYSCWASIWLPRTGALVTTLLSASNESAVSRFATVTGLARSGAAGRSGPGGDGTGRGADGSATGSDGMSSSMSSRTLGGGGNSTLASADASLQSAALVARDGVLRMQDAASQAVLITAELHHLRVLERAAAAACRRLRTQAATVVQGAAARSDGAGGDEEALPSAAAPVIAAVPYASLPDEVVADAAAAARHRAAAAVERDVPCMSAVAIPPVEMAVAATIPPPPAAVVPAGTLDTPMVPMLSHHVDGVESIITAIPITGLAPARALARTAVASAQATASSIPAGASSGSLATRRPAPPPLSDAAVPASPTLAPAHTPAPTRGADAPSERSHASLTSFSRLFGVRRLGSLQRDTRTTAMLVQDIAEGWGATTAVPASAFASQQRATGALREADDAAHVRSTQHLTSTVAWGALRLEDMLLTIPQQRPYISPVVVAGVDGVAERPSVSEPSKGSPPHAAAAAAVPGDLPSVGGIARLASRPRGSVSGGGDPLALTLRSPSSRSAGGAGEGGGGEGAMPLRTPSKRSSEANPELRELRELRRASTLSPGDLTRVLASPTKAFAILRTRLGRGQYVYETLQALIASHRAASALRPLVGLGFVQPPHIAALRHATHHWRGGPANSGAVGSAILDAAEAPATAQALTIATLRRAVGHRVTAAIASPAALSLTVRAPPSPPRSGATALVSGIAAGQAPTPLAPTPRSSRPSAVAASAPGAATPFSLPPPTSAATSAMTPTTSVASSYLPPPPTAVPIEPAPLNDRRGRVARLTGVTAAPAAPPTTLAASTATTAATYTLPAATSASTGPGGSTSLTTLSTGSRGFADVTGAPTLRQTSIGGGTAGAGSSPFAPGGATPGGTAGPGSMISSAAIMTLRSETLPMLPFRVVRAGWMRVLWLDAVSSVPLLTLLGGAPASTAPAPAPALRAASFAALRSLSGKGATAAPTPTASALAAGVGGGSRRLIVHQDFMAGGSAGGGGVPGRECVLELDYDGLLRNLVRSTREQVLRLHEAVGATRGSFTMVAPLARSPHALCAAEIALLGRPITGEAAASANLAVGAGAGPASSSGSGGAASVAADGGAPATPRRRSVIASLLGGGGSSPGASTPRAGSSGSTPPFGSSSSLRRPSLGPTSMAAATGSASRGGGPADGSPDAVLASRRRSVVGDFVASLAAQSQSVAQAQALLQGTAAIAGAAMGDSASSATPSAPAALASALASATAHVDAQPVMTRWATAYCMLFSDGTLAFAPETVAPMTADEVGVQATAFFGSNDRAALASASSPFLGALHLSAALDIAPARSMAAPATALEVVTRLGVLQLQPLGGHSIDTPQSADGGQGIAQLMPWLTDGDGAAGAPAGDEPAVVEAAAAAAAAAFGTLASPAVTRRWLSQMRRVAVDPVASCTVVPPALQLDAGPAPTSPLALATAPSTPGLNRPGAGAAVGRSSLASPSVRMPTSPLPGLATAVQTTVTFAYKLVGSVDTVAGDGGSGGMVVGPDGVTLTPHTPIDLALSDAIAIGSGTAVGGAGGGSSGSGAGGGGAGGSMVPLLTSSAATTVRTCTLLDGVMEKRGRLNRTWQARRVRLLASFTTLKPSRAATALATASGAPGSAAGIASGRQSIAGSSKAALAAPSAGAASVGAAAAIAGRRGSTLGATVATASKSTSALLTSSAGVTGGASTAGDGSAGGGGKLATIAAQSAADVHRAVRAWAAAVGAFMAPGFADAYLVPLLSGSMAPGNASQSMWLMLASAGHSQVAHQAVLHQVGESLPLLAVVMANRCGRGPYLLPVSRSTATVAAADDFESPLLSVPARQLVGPVRLMQLYGFAASLAYTKVGSGGLADALFQGNVAVYSRGHSHTTSVTPRLITINPTTLGLGAPAAPPPSPRSGDTSSAAATAPAPAPASSSLLAKGLRRLWGLGGGGDGGTAAGGAATPTAAPASSTLYPPERCEFELATPDRTWDFACTSAVTLCEWLMHMRLFAPDRTERYRQRFAEASMRPYVNLANQHAATNAVTSGPPGAGSGSGGGVSVAGGGIAVATGTSGAFGGLASGVDVSAAVGMAGSGEDAGGDSVGIPVGWLVLGGSLGRGSVPVAAASAAPAAAPLPLATASGGSMAQRRGSTRA